MGVIVDTSVLIEIDRARDRKRLAPAMPDEETAMSVISLSELLLGVERAPTPALAAVRSAFANEVARRMPILPIDEAVARRHALLQGQIGRGITLESHDLWIAATAIANGFSVYTFNVRDFARMPGLTLHPLSFA